MKVEGGMLYVSGICEALGRKEEGPGATGRRGNVHYTYCMRMKVDVQKYACLLCIRGCLYALLIRRSLYMFKRCKPR